MLGSSRGLESGSRKRGEIHHIATGHGPMVQGGLLTAHPGGVHGDGWSPRGGSSFRQGAEAASPGYPILKWRRRRYREENRNSRLILGVSVTGGKYRPKGAPRGATGHPGGLLARPRVGPRQGPWWVHPFLPW